MTQYFQLRGGGGDADTITLGQVNNLFGATSGDASASPITVTPAASRSAAEAVRDAYATANASWLTSYNNNANANIRLFYMDNGNTIIVHQIRQGGAWVDNGTVVGVEGLPGTGINFSHLDSYEVPMVGEAPDKLAMSSGIFRTSSGTGMYEAAEGMIFPRDSIQIGHAGVLSGFGALIKSKSFVTGQTFIHPWQYYTKANGSQPVRMLDFGAAADFTVYSTDTTNMTTSGTYSISVSTSSIVWEYVLKCPPNGTLGNFRCSFQIQGQDDEFYYFPNKARFESGDGEDIAGDAQGIHRVNLEDAPIYALTGQTVIVDYRFDSGTLLGDGTNPFTMFSRSTFTLEEVVAANTLGNQIALRFNAKNNRTLTAIPANSLCFFVDNIVSGSDGNDYIEVEYLKGSAASLYLPNCYVPESIAADALSKGGAIVKGAVTINSDQITVSNLPKKLYAEKTGTGVNETWRFTETAGSDTWYCGTILATATGTNNWDVFLDFSLIQAHEHANEIDENVTAASFDEQGVLTLDRNIGGDLTATLPNRQWQASVSSTLSTPPSSPSDGERYIVGANPQLTWASHVNKIAEWNATDVEWKFFDPSEGTAVYQESDDMILAYNGSSWEQVSSAISAESNGVAITGSFNTLNFIGDHHDITANATDSATLDISIDPESLMIRNGTGGATESGQPAQLGADSSGNEVALDIDGSAGEYPTFWSSGAIANNATGEFITNGIIRGVSNIEETTGRRQLSPDAAGTTLYWHSASEIFTTVESSNFFEVGEILTSSYLKPESTFYDSSLATGNTGISTEAGAEAIKNRTLVVKASFLNGAQFQLPNLSQNTFHDTFEVGDGIAFTNSVAGRTLTITIEFGGTLHDSGGLTISSYSLTQGKGVVINRIAGDIWQVAHENDQIVTNDIVASISRLTNNRVQNNRSSILSNDNDITALTNSRNTLGQRGINGLQTRYTAGNQVTISTGSCFSDNGTTRMIVNSEITVTMPTDLDTGSEATDTWYYIWLFRGETTETDVVARFSTSNSSPTAPASRPHKRLIGAVYNSSGANFRRFVMRGQGDYKQYLYTREFLTVSNATISARTAVNCASVVPNMPEGYPFPAISIERNSGGGSLQVYNADELSSTMQFIDNETTHATIPMIQLNSSGQFHVDDTSGNVGGVYIKIIGFTLSL